MDEALKVYGWRGILAESLKATEIKSRADARKLGPFADHDHKRVLWVNLGVTKETGKIRKRHFRHYPKNSGKTGGYRSVNEEMDEREKARGESSKHLRVKDSLFKIFERMVKEKQPARWSFVDKRISEFPLSGNLLSEVVSIEREYSIHTPFGKKYELDIALLGQKVREQPIILGGIEIEFTHEFEMLKCLLCKSLGFPLVCLDITEVSENEITEKWCEERLLETTTNSDDALRRNYIYIHEMLYPVYMDIPSNILKENRHQYVIFCKDREFDKLVNWLKELKVLLGIQDNTILIQPVNCTNDQMRKIIENEGSIAGHNWRDFNGSRFIRVNLDKPVTKSGPLYKYHLLMAHLLNGYFETLVGYKYRCGVSNKQLDDHVWKILRFESNQLRHISILPKHVSEPVISILAILSNLQK